MRTRHVVAVSTSLALALGVAAGFTYAHIAKAPISGAHAQPPKRQAGKRGATRSLSTKQQIAAALRLSNDVWVRSFSTAEDAGLARAKTGLNLSQNEQSVAQLQGTDQHWQIHMRRFAINSIKVDSTKRAEAVVSKDEQSKLFDGSGDLLTNLAGPYRVHYWLLKTGRGWMVARTLVVSSSNRLKFQATPTPRPTSIPTPTPTVPPTVDPSIPGSDGYAPDGSFTNSATSMRVRVSDVKGVATNDPTIPDGYILVVFYVRIDNQDFAPHDINSLDFECIDHSDQQHDTTVFLPDVYAASSFPYGTIAGQDSRAGWVGCEVPNHTSLRITWDDSYNLSPPASVWPN